MTTVSAALLLINGCGRDSSREVIVYVTVDQVFSEPVLREFERQIGIQVKPVYDVEAAKTTGLVTRLIAEKENPRADVFWSNEFVQTLRLKEQGVLAPATPANVTDLPIAYRDPDGHWFGLGGRARVLLVNTDLVKPVDYPRSLNDLLNSKYPPERVGLALPLFGTTATHAAALYAVDGETTAREFFTNIKRRGVRVLDGNSMVRDLVVSGQLLFGLTDSDDALGALERMAPVTVIVPDQETRGTMVVFGTVAMINGARHSEEARLLMDYLLSIETEQRLIRSGCFQWSVRENVPTSTARSGELFPQGLKPMAMNTDDVLRNFPQAMQQLREIFVR